MCFSYSVIVRLVESQHLDTEKQDDSMPCRQLSWLQLCSVSRVNEHAAKVFSQSLCLVGLVNTKSTCKGKGNIFRFKYRSSNGII